MHQVLSRLRSLNGRARPRPLHLGTVALLFVMLHLFSGVASAAGYPPGCREVAPSGWTRTIYWVLGQEWNPGREGPWQGGTTVSVHETNDNSRPPCESHGGGEAYTDGTRWWGTFRKYYFAVERGENREPGFGRIRFARARWWSGWVPPQKHIADQQVKGYWLMSTASGGPGDQSVFVAGDEEIWRTDAPPTPTVTPRPTSTPQPGTIRIEIRQCSASGPLHESWVQVWAGDWSEGTYGSSLTFTPPGRYARVGYAVAERDGWSSAGGEADVGQLVTVVVRHPICTASPAPTATGTPPPTQGPPGCARRHDVVYDPASVFWPQRVTDAAGQSVTLPQSENRQLPQLQPDQVVFSFENDRSFAFDHDNDANARDPSMAEESGMLVRVMRAEGGPPIAQLGVRAMWNQNDLWKPQVIIEDEHRRPVTFGLAGRPVTRGNWDWGPTYAGRPAGSLGVEFKLGSTLAPGRYRIFVTSRTMSGGIGYGYSLPDWWNGEPTDLDCPEGYREASFYFEVQDAPLTIKVQQATMAGDHGEIRPLGGVDIRLEGAMAGKQTMTTDASGIAAFPWSDRVAPGSTINVVPSVTIPDAPAGVFTWKIEQNCNRPASTAELNASRYNGLTGPCQLIFTVVPVPVFDATVERIYGFPETPQPFHGRERRGCCYYDWSAEVFLYRPGQAALHQRVGPDGRVSFVAPVEDARSWVASNTTLIMKVFPRLTVGFSSEYDWYCNQRDVRAGEHGRLVRDGCAWVVHIKPAGPSRGNYFLYRNPNVRIINVAGRVVEQATGGGVAGATVTIEVRDETGAVPYTDSWLTAPSGSFSFNWAPRYPPSPAATVTLRITGIPDKRRLVDVVPGGVSPAQYPAPSRNGNDLVLTLPANVWADVTSDGNLFVVSGVRPPPPPPPTASGALTLNIHSRYDPDRGVYRSAGQEISWPQSEPLDFTAHLELDPLPAAPPGYRFGQRTVAWSYLGSLGQAAESAPDDYPGHPAGCRARSEPTAEEGAGADLSGLGGCTYRYIHSPTVGDLAGQAHALWSTFVPTAAGNEIYVYRLPRSQAVDLRIQVAVLVEVIDVLTGQVAIDPFTGQPVRSAQVFEGTFKVNLVAPRSVR